MRIRVKICGVRTVEAIEAAVAAGADAIGFVLTPSPRRLDIETARNLACHVPTFVSRVAVLHQPSTRLLNAVCSELAPDVIQCEPSAAIADIDRPFLPVFHDHPYPRSLDTASNTPGRSTWRLPAVEVRGAVRTSIARPKRPL